MCTTSEIFYTSYNSTSDIKEESGYDAITFEDYKFSDNFETKFIKEEPVECFEIVELTDVNDIHSPLRFCDFKVKEEVEWRDSNERILFDNEEFCNENEKCHLERSKNLSGLNYTNCGQLPINHLKLPDFKTKQNDTLNSTKVETEPKNKCEKLFSIKDRKCFLVHDHSYSQFSNAPLLTKFHTDDDEESSQDDHDSLSAKNKLNLKQVKSKHKSNIKKSLKLQNISKSSIRSSLEDFSSDQPNSNFSQSFSNFDSDESMNQDEDGIKYKEISPIKLIQSISETSKDDHSCYTKSSVHNFQIQSNPRGVLEIFDKISKKSISADVSRNSCDTRINNAMDLKKCFEGATNSLLNSVKMTKSRKEEPKFAKCSSSNQLEPQHLLMRSNKGIRMSPNSPQSNVIDLSTDTSDSDEDFQMTPNQNKTSFHNELKTKQLSFPLKCAQCPMIFNDTLRLNRHKRTHQIPQFQCRNCLRKFKRKSMLKKHFCDIKCTFCPDICSCEMNDSRDCIICQKINFRYFVDYKQHMMTYHNEIVSCKICEKNNYTLFKHKQFGHDVVRSFKCTDCTSILKSKEQLEYHMEIHAKNFPCSRCGKIFTRRYLLKQHELTHENPKQFHCDVCDKNFQRKFCLDKHRKVIHSDKRREESTLKQQRSS